MKCLVCRRDAPAAPWWTLETTGWRKLQFHNGRFAVKCPDCQRAYFDSKERGDRGGFEAAYQDEASEYVEGDVVDGSSW